MKITVYPHLENTKLCFFPLHFTWFGIRSELNIKNVQLSKNAGEKGVVATPYRETFRAEFNS
jgi:hypothetical protein